MAEQLPIFAAQLKLAAEFDLPVSIHARHAVDAVSAAIRKSGVRRGVIHAFNGSSEQAKRLIDLGFKLGFGGALMLCSKPTHPTCPRPGAAPTRTAARIPPTLPFTVKKPPVSAA